MQSDLESQNVFIIKEKSFEIVNHPILSNYAYIQEGRRSLVYKLQDHSSKKFYALKILKPHFRDTCIFANFLVLKKYENYKGMRVFDRSIILQDTIVQLYDSKVNLNFAILMPWIDGILWSVIVTRKITLSKESLLILATNVVNILSLTEKNGNAHCDISGENIVVDPMSKDIELIDIEDMYGPDLVKPLYVPAGSDGYQHRQSQKGQWCANADRFAASVLLAEMLTWHKLEIRNAAFGEQYFDPHEMQNSRSKRYSLLVHILNEISSELAELFECAWISSTLEDCPKISDWSRSITKLGKEPRNEYDFTAATKPPCIKILLLSADPTNVSRLRLGEEIREIQEKLKLSQLRDRFELHQCTSIRAPDLSQALLDIKPQIVQFSGHGIESGAIYIEDNAGNAHPLEPDALAALFEQFTNQVNCVVLNACYSEVQAHAIAKHIDFVIGMNSAIGDRAAIAFTVGFYQALGAGRSIEKAYEFGIVQIRLQGITEHLIPKLFRRR